MVEMMKRILIFFVCFPLVCYGQGGASLVQNSAFGELPPADRAALLRAQVAESRVAELVTEYLQNYEAVAALEPLYRAATQEAQADSIYARYLELEAEDARLSGEVDSLWSYIFDNKLFAYTYLLEIKSQSAMLSRFDAAIRATRDRIVQQRGESHSDEVMSYFEQKRLILEYEKALAEVLELGEAADSLRRAAQRFEAAVREIPLVAFERRLFIDFQDIKVYSPARHNAQNPIPELKIYPPGSVYYVLLESYTTKQAVATFRGLYPLSYLHRDGRYSYFAGRYTSREEAEKGAQEAIKRGFRNARAVDAPAAERINGRH